MEKLKNVAKYIRSKNAGPFWVTIDIFCETDDAYERIAASSTVCPQTIAKVYQVDAEEVKLFHLPSIRVIKVSFPRRPPQGAPDERDMHAGQQYIPLLDLEI